MGNLLIVYAVIVLLLSKNEVLHWLNKRRNGKNILIVSLGISFLLGLAFAICFVYNAIVNWTFNGDDIKAIIGFVCITVLLIIAYFDVKNLIKNKVE